MHGFTRFLFPFLSHFLSKPSRCGAWSFSLLFSGLIVAFGVPAYAQDDPPLWNRIYVSNLLSNDVTVVDLNEDTLIARIPVGNSPTGMAVMPDLSRIFVANLYSGTVSVIETATNEVAHTIELPATEPLAAPFGIVLTPDGSKLYLSNLSDGTVLVYDTATYELVATIHDAYDWALRYLAISPDGSYVWALGNGDGKASIIDTSTNEVIKVIPDLPSARAMVFAPDGSRAYVVAEKRSQIYVIDTSSYELLTTIEFDPGAGTITIDMAATGKYAMVSNFFGKPTIIDTDPESATYHQILAEIEPLSSYQYCIALAPDGRFAYLSNQSDRGPSPNSINVIDLDPESETRFKIIKSVPVGQQPWGIAVVKQFPKAEP